MLAPHLPYALVVNMGIILIRLVAFVELLVCRRSIKILGIIVVMVVMQLVLLVMDLLPIPAYPVLIPCISSLIQPEDTVSPAVQLSAIFEWEPTASNVIRLVIRVMELVLTNVLLVLLTISFIAGCAD